nr:hypothetical protein [Butyrivibrio sp. FCS014]
MMKAIRNLGTVGMICSVAREKNALEKAPRHIKPQCPILSSPRDTYAQVKCNGYYRIIGHGHQ